MLCSDPLQSFKLCTLEHLVSLALVSPRIQRSIDETNVDSICEYQMKRYSQTGSFLFLGHITVADVGGTTFLLDGQHRYRAMQRIYTQMPTYMVLVLTLKISSTFSLSDAFVLLNKSTPVPDYIISTTVDESKRAILDDFVMRFSDEYKPYLVKTNRPQRPNVNINHVVDAILNSNLLDEIQTGQGLLEYIKYLNVNVFPSLDARNVQKCIDKARKSKCKSILYLSCDKDLTFPTYLGEFMNRQQYTVAAPPRSLLSRIREDADEDAAGPSSSTRKRKAIPRTVRTQLWDTYFAQNAGNCPLCRADMNFNTFHVGHIVALAKGGSDALTNLFPICNACNLAMGTDDMPSYVKKFYGKDMVREMSSDRILIK